MYVVFCYAETLVYSRLDVIAGGSVELLCNASHRTDIMWTYDTHDPYVQYIYWNGQSADDKPRISVKSARYNFHSLVISDVQLNDSGLYSCYDDKGLRKVGYQLTVNGAWYAVTENHFLLGRRA